MKPQILDVIVAGFIVVAFVWMLESTVSWWISRLP